MGTCRRHVSAWDSSLWLVLYWLYPDQWSGHICVFYSCLLPFAGFCAEWRADRQGWRGAADMVCQCILFNIFCFVILFCSTFCSIFCSIVLFNVRRTAVETMNKYFVQHFSIWGRPIGAEKTLNKFILLSTITKYLNKTNFLLSKRLFCSTIWILLSTEKTKWWTKWWTKYVKTN